MNDLTPEARAEAERRYPPDHIVDDPSGATGEAHFDEYGYEDYARSAFLAGVEWVLAASPAPSEAEARIADALKVHQIAKIRSAFGSVGPIPNGAATMAGAADMMHDILAGHPVMRVEPESDTRWCNPIYGSCALLVGHKGPHHGYPEDIQAAAASLAGHPVPPRPQPTRNEEM